MSLPPNPALLGRAGAGRGAHRWELSLIVAFGTALAQAARSAIPGRHEGCSRGLAQRAERRAPDVTVVTRDTCARCGPAKHGGARPLDRRLRFGARHARRIQAGLRMRFRRRSARKTAKKFSKRPPTMYRETLCHVERRSSIWNARINVQIHEKFTTLTIGHAFDQGYVGNACTI